MIKEKKNFAYNNNGKKPKIKNRRVIYMLELEEAIKQLQELNEKLQNLGESL